jgi:hypothetical protein
VSEEPKKILPQKLCAFFGLILMALSPFLIWATVDNPILGTAFRTGLELAPSTSIFPLVFVVIGSLIVWFYNKPRRSGMICVGMGLLVLFLGLYSLGILSDWVKSEPEGYNYWIGPGIYLLVVGGVITILGGVLLLAVKLELKTASQKIGLKESPIKTELVERTGKLEEKKETLTIVSEEESEPLRILRRRLAKGEITREKYEELKKVLDESRFRRNNEQTS